VTGVSGLTFAKTKQTDATSIVPDRVEVTIHKTFGQDSKGSTSGGDSSTILSTGEQMPHFVCDSSKAESGSRIHMASASRLFIS
jgi:hypothetical protein